MSENILLLSTKKMRKLTQGGPTTRRAASAVTSEAVKR